MSLKLLLLAAAALPAAPDVWDERLDDLGIHYIESDAPPGTWYWKLVSAMYENEEEAGGKHHVFIKVLDENGQPLEGQKIWLAWPTGNPTDSVQDFTKGPLDDYWGNLALFGGWCPFWPEGEHGPYGAYVDGPGDQVWGMGLPCNRHVCYRLIWQWTRSAAGDPEESLIANGDFSRGLDEWSVWTERGTVTATVTGGKLHIRADNFNGGVWQQFRTPGAGRKVPVSGFWSSQPAVMENQWAEVLIINGPRVPRDGQDIREGQADVVLVYKNDTWASPGGWEGDLDSTSPVAGSGEFTAAGDLATIVLKSGNLGGAVTGTLFDDIVVGGPPGEIHFSRGDANGDGAIDIADAIALVAHLFQEKELSCEDAADANDDGLLRISDALTLLGHLFRGATLPSSACGPDPTADGLGCREYPACP